MAPIKIGVVAETLTPFCYHSLAVYRGTATLPELIGDRAIAFGLAATLGMLRASVILPPKDYLTHLRAMPFRTSMFITREPELLPPVIRRLNLDGEGGYQESIRNVINRGNLAAFFQTQEVPPGKRFTGAIFGYDPFKEMNQQQLVIRIGLHRNGMVLLKKAEDQELTVRLNAATAKLFGRELSPDSKRSNSKTVERYCLHELQMSREYSLEEALGEVRQWQ